MIDWHPEGAGYAGDGYSVRLLAPYRWEIAYRDHPVAFRPSRKAAVGEAEHQRLEAMRRADLWLWTLVMLLAFGGMVAVGSSVRGTLGWYGVLMVMLYVGVSALARYFAALTRNRADAYRHRLWWERRARWWDPLGAAVQRWWRHRMLAPSFDDAPSAVRVLPPDF